MTSTSGGSLALTLRALSVSVDAFLALAIAAGPPRTPRCANVLTMRADAIDSCTTDASSLSFVFTARVAALIAARESIHHHEQQRRDRQRR